MNQHINRTTRYEDLPQFLTVEEFRRYFGIGRTTAYDLLRRGEVPIKRLGGRLFVPREAVRIDPEAA